MNLTKEKANEEHARCLDVVAQFENNGGKVNVAPIVPAQA